MQFDFQEEIKKLPASPGVYIMHDVRDVIIYVGKAKNLKNRVSQYFRKSHDEGTKKNIMVTLIKWFEYIVTDTEMEALVLENNLIKEHRPKYNTLLRDDKTYPYIKVTVNEDYPRILKVRKVLKDKARYFGPFTSGQSVNETIEVIAKSCKLRTCSNAFPAKIGKIKPCLNYHIGQCCGVCRGNITKEEYRENVRQAIDYLEGDLKPLIELLTGKMEEASAALDFETAAQIRDQIRSVEFCIQKQKITDSDIEDRDIIAIAGEGEEAIAQMFFVREGRIIGRDHFYLTERSGEERSEMYRAFITQYYSGTPYIPHEIFIDEEVEDASLMEEWLSGKRGRRVYIRVPKRGQKEKLMELAQKNARMLLLKDKERIKREEGRTIGAVKELSSLLGLPRISRMEAYDISHISGYATVGSMVVFEGGKPKRSDYRKFRIRSVEGPDDYASMKEVLTRRLSHTEPNDSFNKLPDLILMDGGKGQVGIALEVLSELSLKIPVCGMVKDDHHNTRGLYFNGVELPIDKKGEGFKLITRLQDEAHRFAIEYHRLLRSKGQTKSFLDDIEGIGPKRRKALMRSYPGVAELKAASLKELTDIPSMDAKSAAAVYDYLHKEEQ